MNTKEREKLRQKYLPDPIKVLFIGESPPDGGTFFYCGDSNLYKYTLQAFECVYGKQWDSSEAFLKFFKDSGCYLVDLCHEPVDDLPYKSRERRSRRRAVSDFGQYIKNAQPRAIITIGKDIWNHVQNAIKSAGLGLERPTWWFYFPAQSHQVKYVEELYVALKELRDPGAFT